MMIASKKSGQKALKNNHLLVVTLCAGLRPDRLSDVAQRHVGLIRVSNDHLRPDLTTSVEKKNQKYIDYY